MVGVANLENMCDVIYVRTQTAIIFFFIIRVFINVCHNHYKAVKNISSFLFTKTFYSVLTKDIHSTLYLIATAATTTTVATATTAATAATL